MIGRIWAITINTYREALRQKILYTLIFFTVALLLFSFFLGQLTLGADTKVIKDMGLAAIMLFGSLISIFMGIGLIYKEIERRTIYTILSKPVARWEFVIGKFLGLALTLALEIVAMTLLLFVLLSIYREPVDWNLTKAVLTIYFELCVLSAVALVFSSYSSSFMSALFCVSFLILGHLTDDFASLAAKWAAKISVDGGFATVAARILTGFSFLLNLLSLDHFVLNAKIVHGVPVSWMWVGNSAVYALCWIGILLTLATTLFHRKDLK